MYIGEERLAGKLAGGSTRQRFALGSDIARNPFIHGAGEGGAVTALG